MARLLLQNLSKTFKGPGGSHVRAIAGVDLEVADGESLVLLGPSGSGKTVTLRLVAGLEEPSGGTIAIAGRVVNGLPPHERDVAMVFQHHALYPHLTAGENLEFGLRVRGVARAERERRVREVAEMLGIRQCLGLRPMELSGGQRQRVALGRALARQPALFLFDEPFSNLDTPMRMQLRTEFLRLQKHLGWTSVYVTHDQTDAMTLGDKVAVIREGRISQTGTPLELYERPRDGFVAGFIGDPPMNFVAGHLDEADGRLSFHAEGAEPEALKCEFASPRWDHLSDRSPKPVLLGIRPEHLRMTQLPGGRGANGWKGRVEMVQTLGADSIVQVQCGTHLFKVRVPARERPVIGEEAALHPIVEAVHLFDATTGVALWGGVAGR